MFDDILKKLWVTLILQLQIRGRMGKVEERLYFKALSMERTLGNFYLIMLEFEKEVRYAYEVEYLKVI